MKTQRFVSMVCFAILGLGVAAPGFAEQAGSAASMGKISATVPDSQVINVIGKRVSNEKGENLGVVDNVLVDPSTGQVSALVVGVGGFLGYGAYKYEVPWQRVKFSPDHAKVMLNVARDKVNSVFESYKGAGKGMAPSQAQPSKEQKPAQEQPSPKEQKQPQEQKQPAESGTKPGS